jgi:hypothetical protein
MASRDLLQHEAPVGALGERDATREGWTQARSPDQGLDPPGPKDAASAGLPPPIANAEGDVFSDELTPVWEEAGILLRAARTAADAHAAMTPDERAQARQARERVDVKGRGIMTLCKRAYPDTGSQGPDPRV